MEPFKNNFSVPLVTCFSYHLAKNIERFNQAEFENAIFDKLDSLELKARAQLIADQIHRALPDNTSERYKIIQAMLRANDDTNGEQQSNEEGICGWGMMPLGLVVGQHGLEAFEESLLLLKEMTTRFSSEFDVRYFLLADQERAINIMRDWINDPNHHVRRLVSEGTRPRLPWAMQLPGLIHDPSPMLPMLEALRDDKEEYVRRSVANHLNDIAKDHPGLVASIAKKWMQSADEKRAKLIRHACRTLIKQGHSETLKVFHLHPPKIDLTKIDVKTPDVKFGVALIFSAELVSTDKAPQALIIDYVIHFLKANGTRSGKVFKWKKLNLNAGEIMTLEKYHAIRPITTRRYYHGIQAVSLRINGENFGFAEFSLDIDC